MSKDNIIPDISFELGAGDLSIQDIMNQTQSLVNSDNNSTQEDLNSFFSNGSNSNDNSNLQSYDDYEDEQSFNFNKVEEFNIENPDDFRSQIQNEIDSAKTTDDSNSDSSVNEDYATDAYSAALQILRDQGILNIPDEVTELDENTLQELIEYDQQLRNQQAFEYLKQQASDPRLAELVDHVLQGGTYEDAITIKEIIDEQYSFAEINTQEEDGQRMLIEMYIREGLNPNSPVDQRRLARLNEEIDGYIENLEGEDLANEAKNYFIEKMEYIKQMERQKIKEREMEMQNYQRQKLQQEQFWINEFKKTLNEKPWSNEKKKEIISQFDIVQLDNGEELELWKYKWNKIWERPELTQVFMDFLSDLDPYELKFKSRTTPVQKQVTNKILEIVNNKKTISNKFKSEGRSYTSNKQQDQPKKAINPASDW